MSTLETVSFTSEPVSFRRKEKRERPVLPAGNLFTRLLTAKALASLRHASLELVDEEFALFLRASSAPAITTVTGWAKELAQQRIADALAALGPASGAAQVMRAGLTLDWNGAGIISA